MGAAQHDAVALHADLHCLTLADIQRAAHFDRDHDPAKLVDAADNTGKFHVLSPLYAVITKSPQILYPYFNIFNEACQQQFETCREFLQITAQTAA